MDCMPGAGFACCDHSVTAGRDWTSKRMDQVLAGPKKFCATAWASLKSMALTVIRSIMKLLGDLGGSCHMLLHESSEMGPQVCGICRKIPDDAAARKPSSMACRLAPGGISRLVAHVLCDCPARGKVTREASGGMRVQHRCCSAERALKAWQGSPVVLRTQMAYYGLW